MQENQDLIPSLLQLALNDAATYEKVSKLLLWTYGSCMVLIFSDFMYMYFVTRLQNREDPMDQFIWGMQALRSWLGEVGLGTLMHIIGAMEKLQLRVEPPRK